VHGEAVPNQLSLRENDMRIEMALGIVLLQIGVSACSQTGDGMRPREGGATRVETPACDPRADPRCQRADEGQGSAKPSVPAVPDSPIRARCEQLPTQVERDTCTNRKESTG
jgi:hypothetical protein